MSFDPNYESLINENQDLQKALRTLEEHLTKTQAEKEQIQQLYNDFKQHYTSMKNQCQQYEKRLAEEVAMRKEIEQNNE